MAVTEDRDEYLTAGRFAALTMLSAKALRIYAERDLLAPCRVDPHNGYRYYSRAQVRMGWLIALLRSADFSLAETGDPFGIFHAPVTDDSDGPLEITLPVDDLTALSGDVRSYRLAGGMMATRLAVGPETDYPQILALYDEVYSWVTGTGRLPVGPPREVWHNSPADPEPLRLTITWPYATQGH